MTSHYSRNNSLRSTSIGRVLQHRDFVCLADCLAQLAAHVVDDEETRGHRVVTNNVVAQLAQRTSHDSAYHREFLRHRGPLA